MHTLLLGLDAFDPARFEAMDARGELPNLGRWATANHYARLEVPNPPQSEVSWTSIATGLNPGGHGLFDFVHRHPASYGLHVSLLPMRRGLLGTQFVSPFTAPTLFDSAVSQGYPATALWWPALFPARPHSPVRTLPGLGTPDVHGRLGVGTLFTEEGELASAGFKTTISQLERRGKGRYGGLWLGPMHQGWRGAQQATLPLALELTGDESARLLLDGAPVALRLGEWSPILELTFKLGRFVSLRAVTRVILTELHGRVRLYALPLQLHPLQPLWRYATPPAFVRQLWQRCGPFLTLGWPQDTTALEEGWISDAHFLTLCEDVFAARERMLMSCLEGFNEGVIGAVFDCLDRIQHMFWRDRPEVVWAWYQRCDALVGRVQAALAAQGKQAAQLLVVSDHGFADFHTRVHLNRWLLDRGYLVAGDGAPTGSLAEARWPQSRAYALGLNSLYLNIRGREGQGTLLAAEAAALAETLRAELLAWRDPSGRQVIQRLLTRAEAFQGPLAEHGPDLVIGYAPGFRASGATGLGRWEATSLETNGDHWSGDHCMDAAAVPGVIFGGPALRELAHPSYADIPPLVVGTLPTAGHHRAAPPPDLSADEQATLEERLKGLGYLD